MSQAITRRQLKVLTFIYQFKAEHGYAPCLREIGAELGCVSTNAVSCHLMALERKGLLTRDRMIARSLVLSDYANQLARTQLAETGHINETG